MEGSKSMNRRRFIKKIGVASATAVITGIPSVSTASNQSIKITFLHTNDVHSRIEPFPMDGGQYQGLGGVARRNTLIQQIRKQEKNVLLFDAGDMFQGTPYFNLFGGKLELELMSKMRYDAGTFGNHEFDNGLEGLNKHLHRANFPFLTANYGFGGTVLEGKTKDYEVFVKDGVKIGVFGLGIDVTGLVDPNNHKGVEYLDPIETANRIVPILKNKYKCDFVICLSHIGYAYSTDKVSDCILAAKTQDIDLIIGGHTHTFLEKPTEIRNLNGKITLVNQTGFAGINLGRIDFIFEPYKNRKKHVAYTYQVNAHLDDIILV